MALLLVAVLALAWAHGVAAVQLAAWLIRCRVAASCAPTCPVHGDAAWHQYVCRHRSVHPSLLSSRPRFFATLKATLLCHSQGRPRSNSRCTACTKALKTVACLGRRDHGSEVIAGVCLAVVALKAALAANLDTRLRDFLDSMDDMNVGTFAHPAAPLLGTTAVCACRHGCDVHNLTALAATSWLGRNPVAVSLPGSSCC